MPKVNLEAVSFKPHSSAWLPGMVSLKQDFLVVGDKGEWEVKKRKGGREVKTPCYESPLQARP